MSRRRVTLIALLVLPLALASCKINTINNFPSKPAHVRAVNVVADAPVLDVSANDVLSWPGVAFEASTDYLDLDNVQTTFAAKAPNAASPLVQSAFSLAGEQAYSVVTFGTTSAPSLMLVPDVTIQPGSGRTQLRLANAAAGIGLVDVYITAPGVALNTVAANLVAIDYSNATTYLQFTPGTYQVRITGSGTQTVLYDSGAHVFSDNTATDLIMYSRTSGRLPSALFVDVNGANQRGVVANTLANVKFMNAAPQAGNVNVLVDGTALFSNLAYPLPTGYSTVTAGIHAVAFEASATPGTPIATATPTLAPATDSTIVVTGLAGSTHAFVLADNNLPPLTGNARLRFVNASINVGPLDVLVNGVKQASAVAPDSASAYIEIAAGTYTIAFADPATGAVRLSVPGVNVTSVTTNTIFVAGTADALTSAVSVDD